MMELKHIIFRLHISVIITMLEYKLCIILKNEGIIFTVKCFAYIFFRLNKT